jgi:CRISPR-associated protein Cst2
MKNQKLTHITGTFVIDAMPSFLNGAGISKGTEDRNYTILKTFEDGVDEQGRSYRTCFVSAQSWRKMLRDSLIEETNWPKSQMRALHNNADGHTDKVGTEKDPVGYVEDDAFGYMFTQKGSGKIKVEENDGIVELADEKNGDVEEAPEEAVRVKTVSRTSPLATSILVGLKKDGWVGRAESYVSLIEGTPLPYKTQFANTPFEGMFSLNYGRLCKFSNVGDRVELDESIIKKYLDNKTLVELKEQQEYYGLEETTADVIATSGKNKGKKEKKKVFTQKKNFGSVYEIFNAVQKRKERAAAIIKTIAVLRGGAKQAAFETDVSPKVLIIAGLTCGNPIFNTLFKDDSTGNTRGKTVSLNVEALKEIVNDYKDRICTPIYVGIRTGFIKNEDEVRKELTKKDGFIVTTPIDAAKQIAEILPGSSSDTTSMIGEERIEGGADIREYEVRE